MRLEIGNSYSRLSGLTPAQHVELKKILSYKTSVGSPGSSVKRSVPLIGRRGEFPTGLLYLVYDWLGGPRTYEHIDTRVQPGNRAFMAVQADEMTVDPYQEQWDAAYACLMAHRGILSVPTGVGKTLIIALIINHFCVRTLVVVPKLELKRQTQEALLAFFGPERMRHIHVENIDALDPNTAADYDCVVIDEFHHAAAASYRKLNKKAWAGIYYRFGLTATPFRSDADERLLLESVLSQVIYRLTYQEAVAKGYIVPVEAYYISVPPKATDGYTWTQVYEDLVTDNVPRNALIIELINSLRDSDKSSICLVKEVGHGESLNSKLNGYFAHGQNADTAHLITLFNRATLKTLLGTTGVIGEGVDTKPCEYVVVAGLGKSKPAFMQQVGRAVRKYPGKESAKVIIFKDNSHKWTKAHFAAQKKILQEEYGVVPVELKLT